MVAVAIATDTAAPDRAPDWVAAGTPEPLRSQLIAALGEEHVLSRAIDVVKYASDASPYRLIPRAVAMPHGVEDVVRLMSFARGTGTPLVFRAGGTSLNGLEQKHRRDLERLGVPLGDAVPRAQVPELLAGADVLLNNMEAGAPDKVVYEAAAACLPVLASNPVFDELFDGYDLSFERESPESLAERLRWFSALGDDERAEIGRTLRERVAERHSVDTWADGVLSAAT